MNTEMTIILRMNDSHTENVPGDLYMSPVGIVLKKVKLFSVLLLVCTWIYLNKASFLLYCVIRSC